jgi:hypothetical protein
MSRKAITFQPATSSITSGQPVIDGCIGLPGLPILVRHGKSAPAVSELVSSHNPEQDHPAEFRDVTKSERSR